MKTNKIKFVFGKYRLYFKPSHWDDPLTSSLWTANLWMDFTNINFWMRIVSITDVWILTNWIIIIISLWYQTSSEMSPQFESVAVLCVEFRTSHTQNHQEKKKENRAKKRIFPHFLPTGLCVFFFSSNLLLPQTSLVLTTKMFWNLFYGFQIIVLLSRNKWRPRKKRDAVKRPPPLWATRQSSIF